MGERQEIFALRKDGSELMVEVQTHAISFGGRAAVLVLAHDVDLSRGGMVIGRERPPGSGCDLSARLCWMHPRPLQPGKRYLLKHASSTVPVVVQFLLLEDFGALALPPAACRDRIGRLPRSIGSSGAG